MTHFRRLLLSALLNFSAVWTGLAVAQTPGGVVESRGLTPGQATAPAANSDALTLLLEQNQQLRTELQALRGMIEEQGFELRRLQRDSMNRYTNIDSRLSALESGAVTASSAATAVPSASSAVTAVGEAANRTEEPAAASTGRPSLNRTSPRSRGTLQPAVLSEQQLYQMAYDSAINSDFERSLAEFDQYLSIYPEGRFVTNAHYWKGQSYLYLERFAEARQSYEIILDQYQDSAKLPDAMYGLALSFQGLGEIEQARTLLNDIKRRFPNTGVANLADTRLLTLD